MMSSNTLQSTRGRPIDRIVNPSEELFRSEYLEKGRPVVIVQNAPRLAQHDWTFEYLTRTVGDCVIPVYDWGSAGPTVNDHFKIVEMPLARALEHCCSVSSTETQRYSVCQLSLDRHLKRLAAEYQVPETLRCAGELDGLPGIFSESERRALFVSFFRGMHWHNAREVLAQLVNGSKRFVLYSPSDSRYLYPRRLLRSGLAWFDEDEAVFCSEIPFESGIENIEHERFPLFKRATPYEVELRAGESLFIPSHWWHLTHASEPCVLVAHFWDAPLSRWGFPMGWRSMLMKPYRKYLYQNVLRWKHTYSLRSKIDTERAL